MKTSDLTVALFVTLFLIACKKENNKEDGPSTFTVVEAVTNTPLAGVRLIPRACLYRDFRGCGEETPIGAINFLITNSEGVATLSGIKDLGSVQVTKEKYWEGYQSFSRYEQPPTATIELYPIATLKIHLIKENQYSSEQRLVVNSPSSSMPVCGTCDAERFELLLPQDTIIYAKAVGNANNVVEWFVFKPGDNTSVMPNKTPAVKVNRFDTALVEIRY